MGLGPTPIVLGELVADRQAPAGPDFLALEDGVAIRAVRDIALEIELHAGDLRDLPRLHLDHDQRFAIRALLAPDGDSRIEKTQGAHQVAGIALGQHDQARQFVVVQVRDFAVTPQFQMLLQQRAHRWRRAHVDAEGRFLGHRPSGQQRGGQRDGRGPSRSVESPGHRGKLWRLWLRQSVGQDRQRGLSCRAAE